MCKVHFILQFFLATFVIVPTAGKTCRRNLCAVCVSDRIHQNHDNGEMAEVDARNKHCTKIMLKGDSPVKTHFLILNPLPVKSRSRSNEKINWNTSLVLPHERPSITYF